MLTFIKYLLQLILSPAKGWEDIAQRNPDPEELLRTGLYPLLGLTAATEFLALFWVRHVGLGDILMRALAGFGSYFVAIFIAKLIFELYLKRVTDGAPDQNRAFTLIVMGIGLMVLIQLISNCLPWNLVLLKFLPLYAILIIYKANDYVHVRRDEELRFLGISAGALVAVPLIIYYLLYLIVA